jgi:hypothetical protein
MTLRTLVVSYAIGALLALLVLVAARTPGPLLAVAVALGLQYLAVHSRLTRTSPARRLRSWFRRLKGAPRLRREPTTLS